MSSDKFIGNVRPFHYDTTSNPATFQFGFNGHNTLQIKDGRQYELAIQSVAFTHGIINISGNAALGSQFPNNIFTYSNDSGATWHTVTIDEGTYDFPGILNKIRIGLASTSNSLSDIRFEVDNPTNKLYLFLGTNMRVDFSSANSSGKLYQLLGFSNIIYSTAGYTLAPNITRITTITSVFVELDVVEHFAFKNESTSSNPDVGKKTKTLVRLQLTSATPNSTIYIEPAELVWVPIFKRELDNITFTLKDQTGTDIRMGNSVIGYTLLGRYVEQ